MKICMNVDKYRTQVCAKFRFNRPSGLKVRGRRLLKSVFSLRFANEQYIFIAVYIENG